MVRQVLMMFSKNSKIEGNPEPHTVSVVIPCYNLGEYLREAVGSVLCQTYPPLETVVVDDGSTDEATLRALDDCQQAGVRVLHTPNRGAPAARNYGIGETHGEYVLCLDADDILLPTFLEETVQALAKSADVGIVTTHVEFFGTSTGVWSPTEGKLSSLLWKNRIASASLFRRKCWEETDGYVDLDACQDWNFWISIVKRGWRWTVVPRVLYRYRRRPGSISDVYQEQMSRIFREMVALHADIYREHYEEILVEMKAELDRLVRDFSPKARVRMRALANRAKASFYGYSRSISALLRLALPINRWLQKELTKTLQLRVTQLEDQVVRNNDVRTSLELGHRIRDYLDERLPPDSKVVVVGASLQRLFGNNDRNQDSSGRVWHLSAEDPIVGVEAARYEGTEFAFLTKPTVSAPSEASEVSRHLTKHYEIVAADEAAGVIFNLRSRSRARQRTFSVVICTYNRANLLGKAIDSIFDQDYPKDKYEIIIIDNNSADGTPKIIEDYARRSQVSFSTSVETQQGLSFARNRGIQMAKHQFVAHLDDDAVACPNWLTTFNDVIETYGARVVGGRVEKVYQNGAALPSWFVTQYVKGFFGVNYREWGKTEKVLRVRRPLYIGGGNSAYDREVYTEFGGYSGELGRSSTGLLAGEETLLNWALEKHDVPIYYSDDAVIYHFLDNHRLTRAHIVQKAFWSGVTNAILHSKVYGYRRTFRGTKGHYSSLVRQLKRTLTDRSVGASFASCCRAIYNLGFLWKFHVLLMRRVVAKGRKPARVA